jgi:RNA polymerase sigma-70 factor (ECF subfamily)
VDEAKKCNGSVLTPRDEPTEAELVRRAIEGDPEAFARLYDANVDRVYRYLLSRLGAPAMAEDLTSVVFLKAWTRLHQYRPGSRPFVAWLFRVAHNAMVDEIRRERRETDLLPGQPAAADPVRQAEERLRAAEVRRAMTNLTEDQRQVLELRFFAGLNTKEIARHTGKREGAIRALQMRGLQSLSGKLSDVND